MVNRMRKNVLTILKLAQSQRRYLDCAIQTWLAGNGV